MFNVKGLLISISSLIIVMAALEGKIIVVAALEGEVFKSNSFLRKGKFFGGGPQQRWRHGPRIFGPEEKHPI